MTDNASVILLGAGGHARVLVEVLRGVGVGVVGFIAPSAQGSRLGEVRWLGDDAVFETLDPTTVSLVNGVGSAAAPELRARVFEEAKARGFSFRTVVDATAIVRPSATLGEGAQVLAGAIIGTGVTIGDDVIVNTGAVIDHDSIVGSHGHISPGVAIAGDVTVGERSHIGIGSRVIQGVTIGSHCTIGAGAVVLGDIPDGSRAVGIPAVARPTS